MILGRINVAMVSGVSAIVAIQQQHEYIITLDHKYSYSAILVRTLLLITCAARASWICMHVSLHGPAVCMGPESTQSAL